MSNVKAMIPEYRQQGITINLFKDHHGQGPWLYVWTPEGQAIRDGTIKEGEQMPQELQDMVVLGIKLERQLRGEFVGLAAIDYPKAVEAVRSAAFATMAEFCDDKDIDAILVNFLDRGIEH